MDIIDNHNVRDYEYFKSELLETLPSFLEILPGIGDNGIFHIRPHAQKSYYEFLDGTKKGSGSVSDSDLLPDGTRMTRQAYWLNRSYIDNHIVPDLRKEY
jgi:hypothetical protein